MLVPEADVAVVRVPVTLEAALDIDDATDEAAEDKLEETEEATEESVSVAEAVSVEALPEVETDNK